MTEVLIESADTAVPIKVIDEGALAALLEGAGGFVKGLVEQGGFKGKAGQVLVVPGESGAVAQVLVGSAAGSAAEAMALRALPARLPAGTYAFELLPAPTTSITLPTAQGRRVGYGSSEWALETENNHVNSEEICG